MNAVDTNVFVYALDADEPIKQAKAVALLDDLVRDPTQTVLPYQVVGEFLSCLRRWNSAGMVQAGEVEAYTRNAMAIFPIAIPTANVVIRSLDLTDRYSLSHWDSMLVAACLEADVDLLYTEDLDANASYDGLRIVNPFA
jgi:predicted nucleic acid-binding protein